MVAVAAMALGACDEAVAPAGASAAVDVRVYLDRDASGTFTAADSGLSGIILTLSPTEGTGASAEATSDAQGVATFPEVAPGSYNVALPSSAPTGTVLATSSSPRVVVSAIGQVTAPEIRYSWIPGSISGRIFRDNDASGSFTEGDTPGAGLYAVLSRSGTRVDSVTTDTEGRFSFPFLTPDSYSLRLENPGSITYADGATRTVVVSAGGSSSISAIFTGALVIPIAEARTRPNGAAVAVVGNVTVRPGRFTSGSGGVNSEIFVQDATGGISVFTVPTADSATLQLGDEVEVSGTMGTFNAQRQIASSPRVVRRGPGTVPTAVLQTAAQAIALTRDGQLIRITNLTVDSLQSGTNPAFTVFTSDASGQVFQIRNSGANTGLTRANFVVGNRYNVTGVLSRFNATAQLRIRSIEDLELGAAITPIATARAGATGTIFTIAGRLTVPPAAMPSSGTNTTNSELWVQDATGGIAVFSVPTADTTVYELGNTVEVTGTRGAFSGQFQLTSPTVVRTGTGSPVAPVSQTITEIQARTLEGQLVTVSGFTVNTIGGGTSAAFNVDGTVDGTPLRVRVSGALRGLSRGSFTVGNTYTVTGILTQNSNVTQIKLRFASDLTP